MKLKIEAVASSGRFASSIPFRTALGCLLCAATITRAASASDIELQGVINGSQNKSYVLIPFQVPAGMARLTVSFSYTGKEEKTTIDLGVEDPERFRGWSGGNLPEAQPRTIKLKAGSGAMLAMVGDTLAVTPDTPLVITIRVTSSLGSVIRVLIEGEPDPSLPSSTIVSEDQTFSSRWLPQLALGKPHWLRAEVHAPDGSLQLLTNPIYLTPQTSLTTRPGR